MDGLMRLNGYISGNLIAIGFVRCFPLIVEDDVVATDAIMVDNDETSNTHREQMRKLIGTNRHLQFKGVGDLF